MDNKNYLAELFSSNEFKELIKDIDVPTQEQAERAQG